MQQRHFNLAVKIHDVYFFQLTGKYTGKTQDGFGALSRSGGHFIERRQRQRIHFALASGDFIQGRNFFMQIFPGDVIQFIRRFCGIEKICRQLQIVAGANCKSVQTNKRGF